MDLVLSRRGEYEGMEYIDPLRVLLSYQMPLGELIVDFYDGLKSRTCRWPVFFDYETATQKGDRDQYRRKDHGPPIISRLIEDQFRYKGQKSLSQW